MDSTCNLLLLAHDSPAIAKLAHELTLDGYNVHAVKPRRLAAQTLHGDIRLVLLAAPDQEQGLYLLRALRSGQFAAKLSADTPALWICATGEPSELLRAFGCGVDDVLRCPWTYDELLARIRALLTRRRPPGAGMLRRGALEIDLGARRASFAGAPVALRRLEYELLAYLARKPGRVCSKRELLREVWGYQAEGATRTVDSHACRLRAMLQRAGAPPQIILTVRGVGYRLCAVEHAGIRVSPGGTRANQARRT